MRSRKSVLLILAVLLIVVRVSVGFAGKDEHSHSPNEPKDAHGKESMVKEQNADSHEGEEGQDHAEKDEHDHGKDEGHAEHGEEEEEGGSAIGPDKGILEKGKNGFKLAPEAIATFGMKTSQVTSSGGTPKDAVVSIKDKKYVYRLKDGWIKRVGIGEIKPGDEVVTVAVGYVRTAEIVTEEGVAHGHSH